MQTSELEMLSLRIREAEDRLRRVEEEKRLRRVEEENEDVSSGRPTPPVSPLVIQSPACVVERGKDNDMVGELIDEYREESKE